VRTAVQQGKEFALVVEYRDRTSFEEDSLTAALRDLTDLGRHHPRHQPGRRKRKCCRGKSGGAPRLNSDW
jgi:hypothetical protein